MYCNQLLRKHKCPILDDKANINVIISIIKKIWQMYYIQWLRKDNCTNLLD